ncbi:hypothetical protein [uncultured Stenotrophomonas sp.]|uniref:hypothetical protein n=1 Tax=uncultured Stenotrophomonas sp. TaxID=165438 RepID=UPI0025F6C9AE|nr:hypothetical protein [uncultured Stenotrophomonas sp.]
MHPVDRLDSHTAGQYASTQDSSTPRDLLQRLKELAPRQDMELPVEDGEEELDPREAMEKFVRKWFADDFMRAMLFGDEEKLGTKPEEWT